MPNPPIERPIPWEIEKTINWCIREALRDELGYAVKIYQYDHEILTGDECIRVKYFYNMTYNKCFIEYDLGSSVRIAVNIDRFKERFNRYMENNFYYDINIRYELLFNDQADKQKTAGTSDVLTPFVIGFITCINGRYEFVYDKQEILNKMMAYIPAGGKKPEKKIEDFFEIVKGIADRYKQVTLTPERKEEYIQRYREIYLQYHNTIIYSEKKRELDEEFGVQVDINSKIPEMYIDYAEAYNEFFGEYLYYGEFYMVDYYLQVAFKSNQQPQ